MIGLSFFAALLRQTFPADQPFHGVSIDTRSLQPGQMFAALPGTRVDGHDFVAAAEAKGASVVLVSRIVPGLKLPQWCVPDVLAALGKMAAAYRACFSLPVIALTGSNGKSTTKEMIACILPAAAYATEGNRNNQVGVPLSVLQLQPTHPYAVFELGASHAGDIAYTVAMVQPQCALITNIGAAHMEGFGSLDGVAQAKGEIYQGLSAQGIAIINADDHYAHFWAPLLQDKQKIYFSAEKSAAEVYAASVQLDAQACPHFILCLPKAQVPIQLKVPGRHQVYNALAAAAACFAVGLSPAAIQKGLQAFAGVPGRLMLRAGQQGSRIIDDTYNANTHSVSAALDFLCTQAGQRIFVFGDMGELGEHAVAHHREVGLYAKRIGVAQVLTCGQYSQVTTEAFGEGAQHFANRAALTAALLPLLGPQTVLLIKGSRSSRMEEVLKPLLAYDLFGCD